MKDPVDSRGGADDRRRVRGEVGDCSDRDGPTLQAQQLLEPREGVDHRLRRVGTIVEAHHDHEALDVVRNRTLGKDAVDVLEAAASVGRHPPVGGRGFRQSDPV